MKKKTFLILLGLLAGQYVVVAQSTNLKKFGIGLNLGTTPGLSVAYQALDKLAVRASYSYLKYDLNQKEKISDENILLAGNMDMSSIALSVEYYPFSKSTFKLIAGGSLVQKGQVKVSASPTESYTFGESVFTPEEVGTFLFDLSYNNGFAPFVGLGFGRAIPTKRVGFGFELGTYYLPKPKVTLTGTERLSSMSEQEPKIQANMDDWRYWPMLNLRLAIRLN
ncbi:hypothetical protein [Flectobacillus major]|jgi:hypothetical protein|uniref:hypothetical protein n=1 Tax=Flectobacillus major TaxID=103 RepID=UPI0006944084|nr:hypothetical protein [Flectobacillus major]